MSEEHLRFHGALNTLDNHNTESTLFLEKQYLLQLLISFRSVVEIAAFYVKLLSGDELSGFCFSCLGFLGLGEFSL